MVGSGDTKTPISLSIGLFACGMTAAPTDEFENSMISSSRS
jgi:hypothetical protein